MSTRDAKYLAERSVLREQRPQDEGPRLARPPSALALARHVQEVLEALVIPVPQALVHVPGHPEPPAGRLVEELPRPLVGVARGQEDRREVPADEVVEVDLGAHLLQGQRGGPVETRAQRLHAGQLHADPRSRPVAREVLVVEMLGEDEEALVLAVQDEASRQRFGRDAAEAPGEVIAERVHQVPVGAVAVAPHVVVHDQPLQRLAGRAEEDAVAEAGEAVAPPEEQAEPLPRRRQAAAAAVHADASRAREQQPAPVEVRHRAAPLEVGAVPQLVLEQELEVRGFEVDREQRKARHDLAPVDGDRARQLQGRALHGEAEPRKQVRPLGEEPEGGERQGARHQPGQAGPRRPRWFHSAPGRLKKMFRLASCTAAARSFFNAKSDASEAFWKL